MTKYERPEPGKITTSTLLVDICTTCGCAISDVGLCSWECPEDGSIRKIVIRAKYERTDKFIGDEQVELKKRRGFK